LIIIEDFVILKTIDYFIFALTEDWLHPQYEEIT